MAVVVTLSKGYDLEYIWKQVDRGQWIKDLAAAHCTFAERLANLQNLTIPSHDPDYGDLGQAFPLWPGGGRDAILQPP